MRNSKGQFVKGTKPVNGFKKGVNQGFGFKKGHPKPKNAYVFPKGHKLGLGKMYRWKGDNAGVVAMHRWVEKWKGTPKKCEVCGTEKKGMYDWANVDHSYKRVLEDYIRMCRSCHRNYDIKNNNWRKK